MGLLLIVAGDEPEVVTPPLRGRLTASRNAKWWRLEMERRRLAAEEEARAKAAEAAPVEPAPPPKPAPASTPAPRRLRRIHVPVDLHPAVPVETFDDPVAAEALARIEAMRAQIAIAMSQAQALERQRRALHALEARIAQNHATVNAYILQIANLERDIARAIAERDDEDAVAILLLAA